MERKGKAGRLASRSKVHQEGAGYINLPPDMENVEIQGAFETDRYPKANWPKHSLMRFHSAAATEVTSPDELMTVLKRYLSVSNESEMVVASRIGINHHTLNRWLTNSQSPTKGRLALTACFLRRVGYL